MFGLFTLFGRSATLKALDHALREAGVHPALVPEAVKLTILRLHSTEAETGTRHRDEAFREAARLFAYCMLGSEQFEESNSRSDAERVERRLDAAIAAGDSLDAQLVLLALHSGLIAPEIADRIDVERE